MTDAKVLDIPRMEFKVGESGFSPIAALVTSMKAFGEKITYRYMMGISGAAFRLYWMKGFDVSSAAVSSENPAVIGARALGYSYYEYSGLSENETWSHVTQSIDEGKPVPACGIVPPMEWQVICGYTAGKAKKLLVESYYDLDPTKPTEVPFKRWQGWGSRGPATMPFAVFKKKGPAPSHHVVAFESLARAVLLAHEFEYWIGPHTDAGETAHEHVWHSGLAAFDSWADDMKAEFKAREAPQKLYANDLSAYTLQDARICAASFMDALSGEFPSSRSHFDIAKAAYHQEAEVIAEARKLVPYPWDAHPNVKQSDVSGFADLGVRAQWVEALRKAKDLDAKATDALGAAIAALR